MSNQYHVECDCASVKIRLTGDPIVRAYCHCEDCRDLLKVPFHSVTAWDVEDTEIESGQDLLVEFQHPTKSMKRVYCSRCGETLYNTNALGWRVVSQLLIRKCYDGKLPEPLQPTRHLYYGRRIVDIDDNLPRRD